MGEGGILGGKGEILLYTARLTCSHTSILLALVNIIHELGFQYP